MSLLFQVLRGRFISSRDLHLSISCNVPSSPDAFFSNSLSHTHEVVHTVFISYIMHCKNQTVSQCEYNYNKTRQQHEKTQSTELETKCKEEYFEKLF